MGIQDRDYYREGPSFLDRVGQQGATVWLVAITCGVFFGQIPYQQHGNPPLVDMGVYDPTKILKGANFGVFIHADLSARQLVAPVLQHVRTVLGRSAALEELYGSREFTFFYFNRRRGCERH